MNQGDREKPLVSRCPSPLKRQRKKFEFSSPTIESNEISEDVFSGTAILKDAITETSVAVSASPKTALVAARPGTCALFFDFDCTLSENHLYGTIRRWSTWMARFRKKFPEGHKIFDRCDGMEDRCWIEDVLSDRDFVGYIFGGKKRIDALRSALDFFKSQGTEFFITTFGTCWEVMTVLHNAGLLFYFSRIQAADGLWRRGEKFRSYADLKSRRISKLDWIEQTIVDRGIKSDATWFIDDSKSNYDDGYGLGVLSSGQKIRVVTDPTFQQNGTGLSDTLLRDLTRSVKKYMEEWEEEEGGGAREEGVAIAAREAGGKAFGDDDDGDGSSKKKTE